MRHLGILLLITLFFGCNNSKEELDKFDVIVIGGGVVGMSAAKMAVGLGARVTVFDKSLPRLRYLADIFGNALTTRHANHAALASAITTADLVIGAVLVPGATAPKLINLTQLSTMQAGAVLVDVAIDQGGCFETSEPTTHEKPIIIKEGIIHYAVTNMPGAVPNTSTTALTNATLNYALELANKGWKKACKDNNALARGLNIINGEVVYKEVADAFSLDYVELESIL